MGVRREYMKHKAWKQIPYTNNLEADLIDGIYDGLTENVPTHASMRDSATDGNSNMKPWVYSAYHSDKWDMIRQKMGKFIEAHVGRSFNKTFSEFKEKFPAYYGSIDVTGEFLARFTDYNPRTERLYFRAGIISEKSRYWSFYIDHHGIIRSAYLESRKPKNKTVKINMRSSEKLYSFRKYVFEHPEILGIVEAHMSKKYRQYLDPEIKFSQKIYDDILWDIGGKKINEELAALHSIEWWRANKYCWYFDKNHYDWDNKKDGWTRSVNALSDTALKKLLFDSYTVEDCDVVEAGSPEHIRYLEDNRKASASERRFYEEQNKAHRESLLHNIMEKRKAEEHKNDIVDRDRLGFDENSFKGEFYHGQKRKKKKNK